MKTSRLEKMIYFADPKTDSKTRRPFILRNSILSYQYGVKFQPAGLLEELQRTKEIGEYFKKYLIAHAKSFGFSEHTIAASCVSFNWCASLISSPLRTNVNRYFLTVLRATPVTLAICSVKLWQDNTHTQHAHLLLLEYFKEKIVFYIYKVAE